PLVPSTTLFRSPSPGDAGAEQLPGTYRRSSREAAGRRRAFPGAAHPPDGAVNRRTPRFHLAPRTGSACLHPLGHGSGAQTDLPATAIDSGRAWAAVAGVTAGGPPGA